MHAWSVAANACQASGIVCGAKSRTRTTLGEGGGAGRGGERSGVGFCFRYWAVRGAGGGRELSSNRGTFPAVVPPVHLHVIDVRVFCADFFMSVCALTPLCPEM